MPYRNAVNIFVFLVYVFPTAAISASSVELDAKAEASLNEFYEHSPAGKTLAKKAKGILVFPSVIKAGIGIGGEFGEGVLLAGGATSGC
jgi:lipid-binding SYLF domain-containing protein